MPRAARGRLSKSADDFVDEEDDDTDVTLPSSSTSDFLDTALADLHKAQEDKEERRLRREDKEEKAMEVQSRMLSCLQSIESGQQNQSANLAAQTAALMQLLKGQQKS